MTRTINGLSVEEYFKQNKQEEQDEIVDAITVAKEKIEEINKQPEIDGEIV